MKTRKKHAEREREWNRLLGGNSNIDKGETLTVFAMSNINTTSTHIELWTSRLDVILLWKASNISNSIFEYRKRGTIFTLRSSFSRSSSIIFIYIEFLGNRIFCSSALTCLSYLNFKWTQQKSHKLNALIL